MYVNPDSEIEYTKTYTYVRIDGETLEHFHTRAAKSVQLIKGYISRASFGDSHCSVTATEVIRK
jgi:hypothetical protein